MISPAARLYQRQIEAATRADGTLDLSRLGALVVGAYDEADEDRRRTERVAELMSAEIEEANVALEHLVADLQAQNLRFTIALDNMVNGLALFDEQGRLVICNRRQFEILSMRENEAPPGCSYLSFLKASPVLSESLVGEQMRHVQAGIETEFQQTLLDQREVHVVLRRTTDGGFLTVCDDVTERARAAARIAHLAYHDPLTDLPNRTMLRERFERALRDGPCALLCLDLDGFKRVNDTYGHTVGDFLLRAVSARLRRNLRASETLARLGGDEFAVLITGGSVEAATLAAQIIELITAPFSISDHTVKIGTSVGIAVAPKDGQTPEQLLRHADMALYRAKRAGRGCYRAFDALMVTDMNMPWHEPDSADNHRPTMATA